MTNNLFWVMGFLSPRISFSSKERLEKVDRFLLQFGQILVSSLISVQQKGQNQVITKIPQLILKVVGVISPDGQLREDAISLLLWKNS